MRMSRKYPNGYLPKIAYWMWLGNLVRVDYFRERQIEKYGPISPDDYETVARIYNEIEAFETYEGYMDVGVPLSEATVEEWMETKK